MMENFKNTLLQVNQNGMGMGDETLGLVLVTNYFKLINEELVLPKFIAFYNSGVKLICNGSPAMDQIKALEQKGVKLIACKTCLVHYNLLDKMEAGVVATMMDIVELQKKADKVISL